jgi:hypothetical protein
MKGLERFSARNHKINTNQHQWAENISDLWRSQTFQTLHTFNSNNFPSQSAQTVHQRALHMFLQMSWWIWKSINVKSHIFSSPDPRDLARVFRPIIFVAKFSVSSMWYPYFQLPSLGLISDPGSFLSTFCTYRINPIYIYVCVIWYIYMYNINIYIYYIILYIIYIILYIIYYILYIIYYILYYIYINYIYILHYFGQKNKLMRTMIVIFFLSHQQGLKWFPQYEIGIISSPLGHMI